MLNCRMTPLLDPIDATLLAPAAAGLIAEYPAPVIAAVLLEVGPGPRSDWFDGGLTQFWK